MEGVVEQALYQNPALANPQSPSFLGTFEHIVQTLSQNVFVAHKYASARLGVREGRTQENRWQTKFQQVVALQPCVYGYGRC